MSGVKQQILSEEAAWSTADKFEGGNTGHRPRIRAVISRSPSTASTTSAPQWCLALESLGVPVEVHHHGWANAGSAKSEPSSAP